MSQSRLKVDYKSQRLGKNIKFPDSLQMYICHQSLRFFFKNFKGQANPEFKHINLRKDYYKVLEVQNDAPMLTIRKSYMKLAKKLHPDVNPTGHVQFTEVQEAYNVLCNGELRKYYDSNNVFYAPPTPKTTTCEDTLNERDRHFYEHMKWKGFEDFQYKAYEQYENQGERKKQQRAEREESEEQKARRKLQEQIEITGRMFRKNPVWQEANSYMNYELRLERQLEKQKQFEELFMPENTVFRKLKKWMSKF